MPPRPELRAGLNDLPATEDQLGIGHYMSGLSEFLTQCQTPMTVAVQGDWGTGKTSAMKIVGERLAAQHPDKRPEIIWFNTWQYAQLGAVTQTAGALLWEICRKVAQVESAQTVQAREKRRRFITQAQQFLVAASVGAAKGATRLAGYGAVVDLVENGKDLWDGLEQTDGGLENPAADVTLLAELRESFASAIRDTGRRFVIFVDDLDRLEPARAVEVMEVIKVLLDVENCIFVLAIDFEIVKLGVREKYGDDITDERAQSFFDKIIQIPFNLPTGSYDTLAYLQRLTGIPDSPDGALRVDLALSSVGSNPRSIKRLFNTLQLLSLIQLQNKDAPLDERRETQLFAMLCMQTRYASVYEAFARAASSLDDEAADRQSEVLEGMLRVPQRVTPETERALPDAGTTEAAAVRYTQFPEVPAEDVDMLEDFLKHLRTAFSTPGGKLDTGALLSAVTSSAVTARDGTRKIAESSRTERDRESRFAALREGGVRPDLIELVGYLEDQAEQLGLSFGMQRKTTEWTGYEPRLRAPGARRDPRHYLLKVLNRSFSFHFEKISGLARPDEFRAAVTASGPAVGSVLADPDKEHVEVKNITTRAQIDELVRLIRMYQSLLPAAPAEPQM